MDQHDHHEQYYLRRRLRQQLTMAAGAGNEPQFDNHAPTVLFSEPLQQQFFFPHHQNLPSSTLHSNNNYHALPQPPCSYNSSVPPDHLHDELVQMCRSTSTADSTAAAIDNTSHDLPLPNPPPPAAGRSASAGGMMLMYRRSTGDLRMEVMGTPGSGTDCMTSRWSRQETLCLLEIRARLDPKFREIAAAAAGTNGGHNKKGPLWEQVSRMMAEEHGYDRSAKKCKEKFENLYKYYRKTKELSAQQGTGGNKQQHYRFFNQLEALCGRKNNYSDCIDEPPLSSNSSLICMSTAPNTSADYFVGDPEDQAGGSNGHHHPNYGTDQYQEAQKDVYDDDKSLSTLSYPFDQVLGYDYETTSSYCHYHNHHHLSINNSQDVDDDDADADGDNDNNIGDHDDDLSTVVLKAKKRQSQLDHDRKKKINKKRISTDHDRDTQTGIIINNQVKDHRHCGMKRELQEATPATSSMEEVIEDCLDSHMKKLMEKQEAWMEKMLNTIEHNERDRMIKEHQWRKMKLTKKL